MKRGCLYAQAKGNASDGIKRLSRKINDYMSYPQEIVSDLELSNELNISRTVREAVQQLIDIEFIGATW